MDQQLKDKVIAITGAASGIGLATTRACAARGATLALCDLNLDPLNAVIDDLRSRHPDLVVTGHRVDVTSSASVDAWIAATVAHHGGRLDGACNIAGVDSQPGVPSYQSIVATTDEHWRFVQDVNLTGVFYCVRAQLRVMQKGASIVNAASTAGLRGVKNFAAYAASKHGVVGLTKSAAKEAGPAGVRVNAVCPGPVDTPLLRRMAAEDPAAWKMFTEVPMQGVGDVDDVAKAFCYFLSDESGWTTGATFTVDGGSSA